MPIITNKTFLELVDSYHRNPDKFVFFVGAGLSQPLFPSWGNLLKDFVDSAKEVGLPDETEILKHIENGEHYLDIAETCVTAMGSTRYRDLMEKVFDKSFSENDIPEGYKALINLSPKIIITTNYDRIPEIGGKGQYRTITNQNAPEASRFFTDNKNVVIKMHGDITIQSSIVLTKSDYQKIINDNKSTRLLLNSILSTKVLIFIGFSLSDPHIEVILNNIMTINEGIPISHYVLLNENSHFKTVAFEKNYGVKIISYTPSEENHPEVVEFLRALNHETGSIPEQIITNEIIELVDSEALINHIDEAIKKVIVGSGFSIFYSNSNIHLSFTPSGETKSEIQKEILSIIKLMDFECKILDEINIYVVVKTPPNINVDESQAILIKAKIKFADAIKYAAKEISTSTIWKLIEFYTPAGLSDSFQNEEKIEFPMSTGIIGE